MSLVAKQQVVMAGMVQELALMQKAMASARKFKEQRHQERGFLCFI